MKYIVCLFFIFAGCKSLQHNDILLQNKSCFNKELKEWKNGFNDFDLIEFKVKDTLHFDNNSKQDFSTYQDFLSVYKPIITYSPDSISFIDIYSYQLNLEKKVNVYYAMPDIDQAILLCNAQTKYWNRIYFGSPGQWVDDVSWISKTKFILACTDNENPERQKPFVLLGDMNKQTLIEFIDTNKNCFRPKPGYDSYKLKKIKIEGL
ncbi:hypothetical protein [Ferruginibacter albus]|uniref:hypothetical protein n=1 Tax=Ferruginibacter albus TaxID=2875540 RepID=UPI001CC3FDA6|nr:hypothetical protein [Ferruginibacter albus]UAY51105.1 hypothetical protein K9M53_10940 [Ferruginibacter albus]